MDVATTGMSTQLLVSYPTSHYTQILGKWRMRFSCGGQRHYGGVYDDEATAARMYHRCVLYGQRLGLNKRRGPRRLHFREADYEDDALLRTAVAAGVSMADFAKWCREAAATLRKGGN